MSDKQKIFFTVQTQQDQNQAESNVSFHDYSQIQIVNAVPPSSPAKKKFIFLGEGEEGTEIYGQQYEASGSFTFTEASGRAAPLILDPNISGAVESVIEVTNNDIGKTEEVQTFTFEEEKFALMEDEEEHEEGNLMKPFECELCKKQFTKIEILKRHIKTHMKEKVCTVLSIKK